MGKKRMADMNGVRFFFNFIFDAIYLQILSLLFRATLLTNPHSNRVKTFVYKRIKCFFSLNFQLMLNSYSLKCLFFIFKSFFMCVVFGATHDRCYLKKTVMIRIGTVQWLSLFCVFFFWMICSIFSRLCVCVYVERTI